MVIADHLARVAGAEADYEAAVRGIRRLHDLHPRWTKWGGRPWRAIGRCSHPLDRERIDQWWRARHRLRMERRCLAEALAQAPAAGEA